MDKFIKVEAFDVVEDETSNVTYLSRFGDSYLDLSNPTNKQMYQFIEENYIKKNGLYLGPNRSKIFRLTSVDSIPLDLMCMDGNEPEI